MKNKAHWASGVVSDAYIAYLACPFLLTVPVVGYGAMTLWKYRWFVFPTAAFCILEIALLLWSWVNRGESKERCGSHIAAYIVFTLCSSVVSSFQGTLIGLYRYDGALTTLLYGVAALLLMRVFHFKRWMLNLFTCSVSLFCGIGLMQLTGRNPLSLFPAGITFPALSNSNTIIYNVAFGFSDTGRQAKEDKLNPTLTARVRAAVDRVLDVLTEQGAIAGWRQGGKGYWGTKAGVVIDLLPENAPEECKVNI